MAKKDPINIIGAGPAGLVAAEIIATAGHRVIVHDRKPSAGRKFLMAGRGGLNLTHSEPLDKFLSRYGEAEKHLAPIIRNFPPEKLVAWCEDLGQETFVGTSGRVFPKSMKASPLLRAWLARLESLGVEFKLRYPWNGEFLGPAMILALGGASWPGLGSDGSWAKILAAKNIPLAPFKPSNCGFVVEWSEIFKNKFAGQPLKNIALSCGDQTVPGEIMITKNGIEGGAVYALSSKIRKSLPVTVHIDLRPNLTREQLGQKLSGPRKRKSFSTYMQSLGFHAAAIGLLRETNRHVQELDSTSLASFIKSVPLSLTAPFPIDRAISTAGGIKWEALDENLMLKSWPGVFVAGEMLDWEAPTGGYLLQASFATGVTAANGLLAYLEKTTRM